MKNLLNKIFIVCTLCCLLSSCITDINIKDINNELNIGTSLALPIGSVHANMSDLLGLVNSTYITSDSTNAIWILYNENNIPIDLDINDMLSQEITLLDTIKLRNKKSFEDIINSIPFDEISAKLPQGNYFFKEETTESFNLNIIEEGKKEILIDSAIVSTGILEFTMTTSGISLSDENTLYISLNYPNVLDDRHTDKFKNIEVKSNVFSFSQKLEDLKIDFNKAQNDSIYLAVNFELVSKGGNVTISKNAELIFDFKLSIEHPKAVFGYIWSNEPLKSDILTYNIPKEVFENELLKNSNLLFSNPILDINATTNIGVPVTLNINSISAIKEGEQFESEFNNGSSLRIDLNRPTQPYDSASTALRLDKDNGSLNTLLSILPEQINLDYSISINQTNNNSDYHFVTFPMQMTMDIMAQIPLQFDPASHFSYNDTIDADFSSLIEKESLQTINIDTIDLYLDIENKLPVNTTLKLIYLDNNDQIITESQSFKILSAKVDTDGRVFESTKETIVLSTNGEAINDVYNTKKIILALSLNGYDENSKIYFQTTDAIDIKLSTFFKIKTSLEIETDYEEDDEQL